MFNPRVIGPGALKNGGPPRGEFIVTASPQLQITIALLQTIANCSAELVSLRIGRAGALHRYEIVITQLSLEAMADLTGRLGTLEGVVSASLERVRCDFDKS